MQANDYRMQSVLDAGRQKAIGRKRKAAM
jgi:hypothetical protein